MKSIQFKSNINWFKFLKIILIVVSILLFFWWCFYIYKIESLINPDIIKKQIQKDIFNKKNVKILTEKEFKKITQNTTIIYKLYIQKSNQNNNIFNQ